MVNFLKNEEIFLPCWIGAREGTFGSVISRIKNREV